MVRPVEVESTSCSTHRASAELAAQEDANGKLSSDVKRLKQDVKRLEGTNNKLVDSNAALTAQVQEAGRTIDLKDQLEPMLQAHTRALDSQLAKVTPWLVGQHWPDRVVGCRVAIQAGDAGTFAAVASFEPTKADCPATRSCSTSGQCSAGVRDAQQRFLGTISCSLQGCSCDL